MTSLKILVISDSHDNIANLEHVMGFAKKINAEAVIHCGDWNNVEAVKTVLSFGIPLYSVLGNADVDPEVENSLKKQSKKFDPYFLKCELDGRKIGVIHNIRHLVSNIESLSILFFGHWQKQKEIYWNGIRAINPGALENEINFAVYDTKKKEVEFVSI